MSTLDLTGSGLLFMKVGLHAGETLEEILARKREEFRKTGRTFWGYGGGTCHPTRQVQPFAKLSLERGRRIFLVMEAIDSHHPPAKIEAKQYSEDGINWKAIPEGINVLSSRYALVLGEIQSTDLEIDLGSYEVAIGPSLGKNAESYIQGRVDKACIQWAAQPAVDSLKPTKIGHVAELVKPYSVFVR